MQPDPHAEAALRLLDEICRTPIPTGPVTLSEEYLEAVRRVEAMPQNRSGSDKTWIEEAIRQFREHYQRAREIH